jgi:ribonuclease HI
MEDNNIDIALTQEPYYRKEKVCGFPIGFRVYQAVDDTPKTAIIIKNPNIQVISIETFTNSYSTFIQINNSKEKMLLISLYCSPKTNLETELKHIEEALKVLKINNYLIAADSNSHSKQWFSKNEDRRGQIMNDFIDTNNLIILNENEEIPTFYTIRGQSSIDLTISSLINSTIIKNWKILLEESLSDHRYITFDIAFKTDEILYNITKKYKTKNICWELFDEKVNEYIIQVMPEIAFIENNIQLEAFISALTNDLRIICDSTLPLISSKTKTKTNKWWTSDLEIIRNDTNRARRKYQRCQTANRDLLKNEYVLKRDQYKQLINEKKLKSWNQFVESNTRDNPWGLIYKIASNKLKSKRISELIDENDRLITDNEMIANTFLETFFPNDDTSQDTEKHKEIRDSSLIDSIGGNDIPFSESEVTVAVSEQNPSKSPGADGISADIIQRIHKIENKFLTQVYNKCLLIETFPKLWKSSIVRIIPKSDKKDYRKANSYRPISLISVFAKILEKLVINRIVYYLRKNNLLNEKQYGFTQQTSTEDALNSLISFIEKGFKRKGFTIVITVDIDGAFNNCWWPKIIEQLRIKNCPKNLCQISKSYFSDRSTTLWFQNSEYEKKLSRGCPQGGAASPSFWNISIDDVFDILLPEETRIEAFADDIIIRAFGNTIEEIENKSETALKRINEWAKENKLKFNPNKTQALLCTKKLKYRQPKIKIEEHILENVKHIKHLGIIIDSKLSWRKHTEYISTKGRLLTNNLIRFAKQKFGLNQKALETIYKGAVLPTITYASSVWYKSIERKYFMKNLETMQRSIGLRIIRGYRTLSTETVNTIANLMPIELQLKQRATHYYIKKGIQNELTDFYLSDEHIDVTNAQKPYDLRHALHYGKRKPISLGIDEPTEETLIYTDGSKSKSGVGSGFCIESSGRIYSEKKFKLSKYCSVFQAELLAIEKALEYILNGNYLNIRIGIITDSETALKAISNTKSVTTFVQSIHRLISELEAKQVFFTFYWTKSHNRNYGNEYADKLSKEAAVSKVSFCYDKYPISYLKKLIYDKNKEIWNEKWRHYDKGLATKKFMPNIDYRLEIKKHFETDFYLTQMITNHGRFNDYLTRFKLMDNKNCGQCLEVEDYNHVIFDCIKYEEERAPLIEKVLENKNVWPCNQSILLSKNIFNTFKIFCNTVFS